MDFVEFPKMARLSREIFITEKLDGTNASVTITEDGQFLTGSRTRWITPEDDNYGFARWAAENREELMRLGPGTHFGEWWGKGIQRNYSMTEKRFSLFNVSRWLDDATRPACCSVVPVLYQGPMEERGVLKGVQKALARLQAEGSAAAPGFMKPEGIVVFHTAANLYFKKTLEKDEMSKQQAEQMAKAAA
jgi:hypothetical protein